MIAESASEASKPDEPVGGLLRTPWFPFVAAIYPLWSIFIGNVGQVSVTSALMATTVALLLTGVLMWVLRRLLGTWPLAALAVVVIVAAFYVYGPLHDSLLRMGRPTRLLARHDVLTVLVLLITACVTSLLVRRLRDRADRLAEAANVAAAVLGLMLCGRLLFSTGPEPVSVVNSPAENPRSWPPR